MDFLSLCQRLLQETGIADSGLTNVTGQTGDMKRLVDWTNEAWYRIQATRPDWDFMWVKNDALSIAQGSYTLTVPADLAKIDYILVDGNQMQAVDYRDFRVLYKNPQTSKPTVYTTAPSGAVFFNTVSDQTYPVTVEYYKAPSYMTTNIETPGMPTRYHMLIVWAALADYALFDEAPELLQKARLHYEQVYAELTRDQDQEVTLPGALA